MTPHLIRDCIPAKINFNQIDTLFIHFLIYFQLQYHSMFESAMWHLVSPYGTI